MFDERYYLMKVNKLMVRLRTACLGQDTPLTAILPAHLKTAPPDKQAAQLAEQVLFALVSALPGKEHPRKNCSGAAHGCTGQHTICWNTVTILTTLLLSGKNCWISPKECGFSSSPTFMICLQSS